MLNACRHTYSVFIGTVDGHEGFEGGLVQDAFRVFSGFVGHEPIDEGESGLRHFNTGKGVVCILH